MINPQLLALIAQVLQSLPHQMQMRGASASQMAMRGPSTAPSRPTVSAPTSGPHSRPAPASATALVSTSTRPAQAIPHMAVGPSSASAAYMSMARKLPAPGIGSHDMTFSGMTKGKGAGNFGM